MPSAFHPAPARDDQQRTIKMQGIDRRSADGRLSHDQRSVRAPCEMLEPCVLPRIVQYDGFAGLGIDRLRLRAFELVARPTRPPQIVTHCRSARRSWKQM